MDTLDEEEQDTRKQIAAAENDIRCNKEEWEHKRYKIEEMKTLRQRVTCTVFKVTLHKNKSIIFILGS